MGPYTVQDLHEEPGDDQEVAAGFNFAVVLCSPRGRYGYAFTKHRNEAEHIASALNGQFVQACPVHLLESPGA